MGKIVYSSQVSLDGFLDRAEGDIGLDPDEEIHRHYNDELRDVGVMLYGRKMYEVMTYWDTALDDHPEMRPFEREFAELYITKPIVVATRTLEQAGPRARIIRDDIVGEVQRMKAADDREIALGGAALAATLLPAGLVDEIRLCVYPLVFGRGTPFWPTGVPLDLELIDTKRFGSGAVLLTYRPRAVGA